MSLMDEFGFDAWMAELLKVHPEVSLTVKSMPEGVSASVFASGKNGIAIGASWSAPGPIVRKAALDLHSRLVVSSGNQSMYENDLLDQLLDELDSLEREEENLRCDLSDDLDLLGDETQVVIMGEMIQRIASLRADLNMNLGFQRDIRNQIRSLENS